MFFISFLFFCSPHSVGWLLEEIVCHKLFFIVFYLFKWSQTKKKKKRGEIPKTNSVQFWIWIEREPAEKEVHSLKRISTHFAVWKVYGWNWICCLTWPALEMVDLRNQKLRSSIVNWNIELNNCPIHVIIVLWPLAFCAVLSRVKEKWNRTKKIWPTNKWLNFNRFIEFSIFIRHVNADVFCWMCMWLIWFMDRWHYAAVLNPNGLFSFNWDIHYCTYFSLSIACGLLSAAAIAISHAKPWRLYSLFGP